MWLPSRVFDLLNFNRDEVIQLRTERDCLKNELTRSNILNDFLRLQINTLQMERTGLIEKVYGIKIPTPLLEKAPVQVHTDPTGMRDFDFEDIGDEMAKKLGLPTYN